jgi:hypothetical protein
MLYLPILVTYLCLLLFPNQRPESLQLVIVGDREFHSIELAQWLHRQHLNFVLRQKCTTTFREKRQPFQALDTIPINPGIYLFYEKISFTQKKGFSRFNLAAAWKRKYRGKQEDEPWYLLTNLPNLKSAIGVYRQRYGIEAMFKDCKSGGYNLEGTQASPEKLISLIIWLFRTYCAKMLVKGS